MQRHTAWYRVKQEIVFALLPRAIQVVKLIHRDLTFWRLAARKKSESDVRLSENSDGYSTTRGARNSLGSSTLPTCINKQRSQKTGLIEVVTVSL
jgi:hypothetical protein